MNAETWLKDLDNAKAKRSLYGLFIIELIIISSTVGVWYESWGIGLGSFALMCFTLSNRFAAKILMISICCSWVGLTYYLCERAELSNQSKLITTGPILLFNASFHSGAFEWIFPKKVDNLNFSPEVTL